jgi:long-chain acyl-CoA synthetase
MRVLLTGATGFVGMEVLARLLERGDEVVAIVRAADRAGAAARVEDVMELVGVKGAVEAVPGDLATDDVEVEGPLDAVIHCAASISFTLPIDEARAINVEGTRRVLDIAARSDARVVHVSTAYVAGRHVGRFCEDQRDAGQAFRNTYEETKLEAEALVEASGLHAAILRPSIVVGEAGTGWTPAFNVMYWPLRAFSRGLLDEVPAMREGRVDVVPVDWVADGIVAALDARATGTYNLAAGDGAATVTDLIALGTARFDRPEIKVVEPGGEVPGSAGEQAAVYVPYFDVETVFDTSRGHTLAGPPPPLASYFDRLIDFAEEARWKKRLPRPVPVRP